MKLYQTCGYVILWHIHGQVIVQYWMSLLKHLKGFSQLVDPDPIARYFRYGDPMCGNTSPYSVLYSIYLTSMNHAYNDNLFFHLKKTQAFLLIGLKLYNPFLKAPWWPNRTPDNFLQGIDQLWIRCNIFVSIYGPPVLGLDPYYAAGKFKFRVPIFCFSFKHAIYVIYFISSMQTIR